MSMKVPTSRDKWIEEGFQKNYTGEDVMGLNLFVLQRPYCKINFTSPELAIEFTNKLAEMYGDKLVNHEYFLQSNIEKTHYTMTLAGEPSFDIERGIVYSIAGLQDEKYFVEAYQMLIQVAEEMGIKVVIIQTKVDAKDKTKITYEVVKEGNRDLCSRQK